MEKLKSLARTLDAESFKDCLCALGRLSDAPDTKGICYVVGGIAVQGYLPPVCRRPTSDVDTSVARPLNYEDFRNFSRNIIAFLRDNKYRVSPKKGSRAYILEVEDKAGNLSIMEFSRRNQQSFDRVRPRLERELANARVKLVEGKECTYIVSSPEDIAIPKLARSVNSLRRNPEFELHLPDIKYLSNEKIAAVLKKIREFRREALLHAGDVRVAEELRFFSDLYDMRTLSDMVGFNEPYLTRAVQDWDSASQNNEARDLLISTVFPELSSGIFDASNGQENRASPRLDLER